MNYDYSYGYEASLTGYEHANCLGHPPGDICEVSAKPARSAKDMRPARTAKESDEDKLKKEINDDFEKAIQDHMNAIEKEISDDKGNKFELVMSKKGPKYNRHASPSIWYGNARQQLCCINTVEREIAETKPMKESDNAGKSWEKIRVKLDSGAIDWVFTPEAGEAFETKPSIFSKYGINYTAANGTEIKNFGQKTLTGYSNEWTPLSVNVQIADVKSNLAAGMKIVEADNRIVLDASGSYIENKITGDRIQIRHENGCFVFDMWVPAKRDVRKTATGTADANGTASRQGARRANGTASRQGNTFQPIAEDDNMDLGEVDEDEQCQAVFVRQEC